MTGEEPSRGRLRHLYPRGAYQCSDGFLAINVPDNLIWKRLATTIGREDLVDHPRCADGSSRATNAAFIDEVIESWLVQRTRAHAEAILNSAGVPVGPVFTASDVFEDPHIAARRSLVDIDDPEVGTHRFARTPVRLSEAPQIEVAPAPGLGEHTDAVISELLGYDGAALERLRQSHVI